MLDSADAATWRGLGAPGTMLGDFRYWEKDGLHHVVFSSDASTNMEVVRKSGAKHKTFKEAVEDYDRSKGGRKLIINGSFGNNPYATTDPWYAQEVMGDVIEHKVRTSMYTPTPDRAFLSFQDSSTTLDVYNVDLGAPPMSADAAISGLCPLIVKGKKFDDKNGFYQTLLNRSKSTGKVVFGQTSDRIQYVGVQPDGVGRLTVNDVRDRMAAAGMADAILLDGSDSAMLYLDGMWRVRQSTSKNVYTKIGLAFF